MKPHGSALALLTLATAACAGGPPAPPALAYGEGAAAELAYDLADTTVVEVSVMGQSMQLAQRGVATWDVTMAPGAQGVEVSMSVRSLAGTLTQPMGAPVRFDESDVSGSLAFTLDRTGAATVTATPRVADEASQMVSGMGVAHTFFPGLPGRAAVPGDTWTDTVAFEGRDGPGRRTERSVLQYTVVGDTVVGGRSLLLISMQGSTTSANDLEVAGMSVTQRSELEVEGHVLWDFQSGTLFEHVRRASGVGEANVPMVPQPLPIRVTATQRIRSRQEG